MQTSSYYYSIIIIFLKKERFPIKKHIKKIHQTPFTSLKLNFVKFQQISK